MRGLAHCLTAAAAMWVIGAVSNTATAAGLCPVAHESVDALVSRADCLAAQGLTAQEAAALAAALGLIDDNTSDARRVHILHRLGTAAWALGNESEAYNYFIQALEVVAHAGQPMLAAPVFNDIGNLLLEEDSTLAAIAAYADGLRMAAAAPAQRAALLLNLESATTRAGLRHEPGQWLVPAGTEIAQIAPAHSRASYLLSLGIAYERHEEFDRASDAFGEALALVAGPASREQAYAYGYLGQLRERHGDTRAALELSREALFVAQAIDAQDSVYQWEWQLARLLRKSDTQAAIGMYELALDSLEGVRAQYWKSSSAAFERKVRPLFHEYVDLVIGAAGTTTSPDHLNRARAALEREHRAELEDYYRDDCANVAAVPRELADLQANVAVLYLVVLHDRVELLLGTATGFTRHTSIVAGDRVRETARLLRLQIELQQAQDAYLEPATALYDWLIGPVQAALADAGITTLVIVPDAALRSVPFAAVHDGHQFLVQSYRLAVTPGLSVTTPGNPTKRARRVLAAGISEARFGFEPLTFVPRELEQINAAFPSRVDLDAAFTTRALETGLRGDEYNIVHIATHGRFAGDYRRSFLVAHDALVPMRRFESMLGGRRFSAAPIDLVVLSACQTAAGDDRAALGLAGVAVQAGARSAIASLWQLNDEATAQLMGSLYRELKNPEQAPAAALQRAQLAMLSDERFSHPAYWAPFVLVGDWQ